MLKCHYIFTLYLLCNSEVRVEMSTVEENNQQNMLKWIKPKRSSMSEKPTKPNQPSTPVGSVSVNISRTDRNETAEWNKRIQDRTKSQRAASTKSRMQEFRNQTLKLQQQKMIFHVIFCCHSLLLLYPPLYNSVSHLSLLPSTRYTFCMQP